MPPNWEDFSQAHLRHASHEREGSTRLRGLIASTLSQTSQDMREQADRVEEALNQRVSETEEATRGLEDNLKQVRFLSHLCVTLRFFFSESPTHAAFGENHISKVWDFQGPVWNLSQNIIVYQFLPSERRRETWLNEGVGEKK